MALHWYSVCDRLSEDQLLALAGYAERQLAITNRRVAPMAGESP